MTLVTAIEDFGDRHGADTCVMTTQTVPRSETGVSEGFVPAASKRLDLLGGWYRDVPANALPGANGRDHRVPTSSVLARGQGLDVQPTCDHPERKAAVVLGQPVGLLATESVAEGDPLRVPGQANTALKAGPRRTRRVVVSTKLKRPIGRPGCPWAADGVFMSVVADNSLQAAQTTGQTPRRPLRNAERRSSLHIGN